MTSVGWSWIHFHCQTGETSALVLNPLKHGLEESTTTADHADDPEESANVIANDLDDLDF